jgi:hypothetical protein
MPISSRIKGELSTEHRKEFPTIQERIPDNVGAVGAGARLTFRRLFIALGAIAARAQFGSAIA